MMGPTIPTEEYFDKGQWGHDGTQWRKLNLVWGYYDRLVEQVTIADASAGNNLLYHTIVPAGYLWIVRGVNVRDTPTAALCFCVIYDGATAYYIYEYGTLVASTFRLFSPGEIVLKPGDRILSDFYGCALHDVLVSVLWGYKMKVA